MTRGARKLRALWAEGRPVANGWLSAPCALTAEAMSLQGYDSLCIDLQHGMIGFADALAMIQAVGQRDCAVLARVPSLEPGLVMKLLDAGVSGLIAPLIDTAEMARTFVDAVRYPPVGRRSFGPTRALLVEGPDYPQRANEDLIAFAMIETAQGVANLEGIAGVEGLDGLYIGPSDLALNLSAGRLAPGFDREEPEIIEVIARIHAAAHASGLRAALHCGSPDYAARAICSGFDFVTIGSDLRLLTAAAQASMLRFRSALTDGATLGGSGG